MAAALTHTIRLLERNDPSLTELNWRGRRLLSKQVRQLLGALGANTTLASLALDGCSVGDKGAAQLAELLAANRTLTAISLRNCGIGNDGAAMLASVLGRANTSVTALDLRRNGQQGEGQGEEGGEAGAAAAAGAALSAAAAAVVEEAVAANRAWRALDLDRVLHNDPLLTELDAAGRGVGHVFAARLGAALRGNDSLTRLSLGRNALCDAGAASIAEALARNTTLLHLDLQDNAIGDRGAASIASHCLGPREAAPPVAAAGGGGAGEFDDEGCRPMLATLRLWHNSVADEGATALAMALHGNASLTALDLGGNRITAKGAREIQAAVAVTAAGAGAAEARGGAGRLRLSMHHNEFNGFGTKEVESAFGSSGSAASTAAPPPGGVSAATTSAAPSQQQQQQQQQQAKLPRDFGQQPWQGGEEGESLGSERAPG